MRIPQSPQQLKQIGTCHVYQMLRQTLAIEWISIVTVIRKNVYLYPRRGGTIIHRRIVADIAGYGVSFSYPNIPQTFLFDTECLYCRIKFIHRYDIIFKKGFNGIDTDTDASPNIIVISIIKRLNIGLEVF